MNNIFEPQWFSTNNKILSGWSLSPHSRNVDNNWERSYLGKKIYDMKYIEQMSIEEKMSIADELAGITCDFLLQREGVLNKIDIISPMPSSKVREFQHNYYMVEKIGEKLNKKVDIDYIKKIKKTPQLKNLESFEEKESFLLDAFQVDKRYKGKTILIFDDLIDNGASLLEVALTLIKQGSVEKVYFITLTRTFKTDRVFLRKRFEDRYNHKNTDDSMFLDEDDRIPF